tara:strand:+ start:759 stop:2501 length:1743 start_codon:yes stop_codon:yes gene_type:complete
MATQKLFIDVVARDKATKALNGLRGGLAKVRGAVFSLQSAFVGLGAGLVVRNLVNTGRELENLQVRLKFLLKDTNEGAKAFDNMVKFASRVPFSLEEIQSGSGILATVTDNAKDLQNMLEITGNVAAVTGLDFRTTAEQIQRSFSAGIGAADLFREKGVRNMLGFQAGAQVSIEATAEAFEKVFGKGGRFGKATDELANTFEGTISMLNDKVFSFKKTLLDAGFFAELKNQFGDLDEFLNDNAEQLDMIAETIGKDLAQATIKAAEGIKLLADNFRDFQSILGLVLVALGGFTTKLAGAALIINDINRRIKKLAGDTVVEFEKIRKFEHELSIPMKNLKEEVELVLPPIREFEHELSVKIPSATEKAIRKFEELNKKAIEEMKTKMSQIRDIIVEGVNTGITRSSEAIARTIVLGENLKDSLKKIAQDALVRILAGFIELGIRMAIDITLNKVKEKLLDNQNKKLIEQGKLIDRNNKKQALGSAFSLFSGFKLPFFASGGSVRKGQPSIIGEKGPELFIPNQTGQITQSARGMNGSPVNVNFNINTVDASGFEELLVRSRGTITQIINNAVNERGRVAII